VPSPVAGGHDFDLPEVTSCTGGIAAPGFAPQHGRMSPRAHATPLRHLLQPLNLAGLFTMASVGLTLRWVPADQQPLAIALLLAFAAAFLARDVAAARWPVLGHLLLVVQPLLALWLVWLTPRLGTAQVLLVVWTVVAVIEWRVWLAFAAILLADIAAWWLLQQGGHESPLTVVLLYAGFQAFAALCAYYARSAEQARDRLALVNADLLATRALLADAARDAERVRVARELHDVAGHKLTALTLNLRALAAEPAFAAREELRTAQQLSRELLGDIRGIVQAMRDGRGLDLATALRALAAPLPKPALRLRIGDDVRIEDPARAEVVLRTVQEALTNAARHAGAGVLEVALERHDDGLHLAIEDDGRLRGPLRPGNGLAGMRERIEGEGGRIAFATGTRGALRIDAWLPA
jgi:signal transduction histidine kinase